MARVHFPRKHPLSRRTVNLPSSTAPNASRVPALAAQWLVQALAEDGWPHTGLLADTGLDPAWITTADATLSAGQYERLLRNALAMGQDEALGITVSRQANFLSRNGFWGYAIMSCTRLDEALDTALRYWPLTGSLMKVQRRNTGDSVELHLAPEFGFVSGDLWRFAVEKFLFSTLLSLGWMVQRTDVFEHIAVRYPAPGHAQRYTEALACPVQFGAPSDCVRLRPATLQWPLLTSQPELAQICHARCNQAMLRLQGNDPLVATVQQYVWDHLQASPTLDKVAAHLATTERTLRRRLQERGQSYQRILDGVRETVARDYLLNTELSIDQIAFLVGFSEPTTFRSTFKRWTGQSAAELRWSRTSGISTKWA